MRFRLFDRLLPNVSGNRNRQYNGTSWIRNVVTGSLFKISDLRSDNSMDDIHMKIKSMRALAQDSQISTALSYYATDATTTNTKGEIIWASSDESHQEAAHIINGLFKRWNINSYVRDHILELATVGNLYIPTTIMYNELGDSMMKMGVALDNNTIADVDFDIIPSYKVPPEEIIHVWDRGKPSGYVYKSDDENAPYISYPESAVIHFSLGGLLGNYTITLQQSDGSLKDYDIMFAEPLMSNAIAPTQTLSLLEDSILLSSLVRVVRFITVDCGTSPSMEEITNNLQQIKDAIEQQLSVDTNSGDAQSFVNPQSPNNLIYLAKVNGQDPISITDLNMAEATEADNKLLEYYQNKKLSVLGVPKEALNFSSNEGLGGAGTVMSQRSALYANILTRLMTAYKEGWKTALNTYFIYRGYSKYVDQFELHMSPIVTTQSTIQFEKRDSALSQALSIVDLLQRSGVKDAKPYADALTEILSEVFPKMGADATTWDIQPGESEGGGGSGF